MYKISHKFFHLFVTFLPLSSSSTFFPNPTKKNPFISPTTLISSPPFLII